MIYDIRYMSELLSAILGHDNYTCEGQLNMNKLEIFINILISANIYLSCIANGTTDTEILKRLSPSHMQ